MMDKTTCGEFFFGNDPVKELNVYKDDGRWYARVVLERTTADGTVQRFTLPRVMIPPVYGIVSDHMEGMGRFDTNYYRLELKDNEFILTDGYDADINRHVAFYMRESKRITKKEAEELLSRDGKTYIIVDEEDNDGEE